MGGKHALLATIDMFAPSKAVIAASKIEVDLSSIPEGIKGNGKSVTLLFTHSNFYWPLQRAFDCSVPLQIEPQILNVLVTSISSRSSHSEIEIEIEIDMLAKASGHLL